MTAEQLEMADDKILIRRAGVVTKSAGGIHLPDTAVDEYDYGTVVSAGPDVGSIEPNDIVFFSGYSGTFPRLPGISKEEFVIIKAEDILGWVRE